MKKMFVGVFVVALTIGVARANDIANMGGGFSGPVADTVATVSVREAVALPDDTHVVLRGHILNSLGDEKYTFADESGQVIVEIDNDDWYGVNVTPEMTVEIFGEVDKGFFKKTKIDVDSVHVE